MANIDVNAINMDALPYIDVTPPYFALQSLVLLPKPPAADYPAVSCTFRREQVVPSQNANSFCGSEIGRHTAILGTVAAAYSNPVKAKHYYLALDAIAEFDHFPATQELRAKARITSADWQKHRVSCEIEIFHPVPGSEPGGLGTLKVTYAILTEPQLLKVVKPTVADQTKALSASKPWRSDEPSPYENPIMLRMVKRPSPDLATAVISLHNARCMAGHFSIRAAAPIAILSSNGILLCRRLLESREGITWLDRRSRVRCQRLAVAGEMLQLKAVRLDGKEFSHRVEFWDEQGKMLGAIDYLFVEVNAKRKCQKL